MAFLMSGVALDVAQVIRRLVLLCYLGSIDPSGWMASPITKLVFRGGLGLKLISEVGGAVRLSLVFVLRGLILGLLVDILLIFLADGRWPFGHLASISLI